MKKIKNCITLQIASYLSYLFLYDVWSHQQHLKQSSYSVCSYTVYCSDEPTLIVESILIGQLRQIFYSESFNILRIAIRKSSPLLVKSSYSSVLFKEEKFKKTVRLV